MRKVEVNMPVGLAIADNSQYLIPAHIELINNALIDVSLGICKRLIVCMPPRHGKSHIISRYFPAWYLLNNPDKRIILTSYEAGFAQSWGRQVRNIINEFGPQYNVSIAKDSNAAHRFNLNRGGSFNTAGAGGAITGKGADLFIIDDPIKNIEEAQSKVMREKLWEWFTTTAYTRLEPGGSMIIIMTRWHYDDLVGKILANDEDKEWTLLSLPAIDDEGVALWPQRFNAEKLAAIKEQMGTLFFNALYQQRPIANENQIFNPNWWLRYKPDELPSDMYKIQSWDTAFKDKEQNDYSVCTTWGADNANDYLIDMWRKRVQFPTLLQAVKELAEQFEPHKILIEDKASGQSLIQTLKSETRLPIKAVTPNGDKVTRAHLVTPKLEAGKVWIPERANWLDAFITETSEFPMAAHDDVVDSVTQALFHLKSFSKVKFSSPNTTRSKTNYFGGFLS